jgi:hypothetical protein
LRQAVRLFGLAAIALVILTVLFPPWVRLGAIAHFIAGARYLVRRLEDQWFAYLGNRWLAIPREVQREGFRDQNQD